MILKRMMTLMVVMTDGESFSDNDNSNSNSNNDNGDNVNHKENMI